MRYLRVTCKMSVTPLWENHYHLQKHFSELPWIVYLCVPSVPNGRNSAGPIPSQVGQTESVWASFVWGYTELEPKFPCQCSQTWVKLPSRTLSLGRRNRRSCPPASTETTCILSFSTGAWKSKWITYLLYHIALPSWRCIGKGFFSGSRYQGKLWP